MTFNTKGLMSSIKQDWKTPSNLYEELDKELYEYVYSEKYTDIVDFV